MYFNKRLLSDPSSLQDHLNLALEMNCLQKFTRIREFVTYSWMVPSPPHLGVSYLIQPTCPN